MRHAYRHGIELSNHRILKIMQTSPALYRIGRTLLASLFVVSGVLKITAFSSVVAYMERIGVPFATIAVLVSILVEAGVGLAILSDWHVRPVAVVVAIFTVIATFVSPFKVGHKANTLNRCSLSNKLGAHL